MPSLSVILPVRNGEKYISAAVRSTLIAMPKDSELHVKNDLSTDRTLERLGEISDPRLKVSNKRTETTGLAAVLNELLNDSDSEYVARMDADDITLPWRFRHQLGFAQRKRVDFVFSPVICFDRKFRISPQRPEGLDSASFELALLLSNPVAHSTMFARRAAIDENGGYRSVHSEDYDLWLRAAANGEKLSRTALPSLLYRRHAAQVTKDEAWIAETADENTLRSAHSALSNKVLGRSLGTLLGLRGPSHATPEVRAETSDLIRAIRSDLDDVPRRGARQIRRLCMSADRRLV